MCIIRNGIIIICRYEMSFIFNKVYSSFQAGSCLCRVRSCQNTNDLTCELGVCICCSSIEGMCIDNIYICFLCCFIKCCISYIITVCCQQCQ